MGCRPVCRPQLEREAADSSRAGRAYRIDRSCLRAQDRLRARHSPAGRSRHRGLHRPRGARRKGHLRPRTGGRGPGV